MKPVKYIIENERDVLWGLTVTTVGHEKISPGDTYPTSRHIDNYVFSASKGRVLNEYQLIYISEGCGVFESESAGRHRLKEGAIFILFPDEWHTYQPDSLTGWTQYWIGFKGIDMDNRVKERFFVKESPIFDVGLSGELISLFQQAIEVAEQEKSYFQQMLAGITNYMLGLIFLLDRNNKYRNDSQTINQINRARILMNENIENDVTIQEIAEKVGVSYSSFRKKFKDYTGLSPSAYLKNLKLQRGKDLLRITDLSVKEIAYRLNFESSESFSIYFHKKIGITPTEFRKRN